jgi:hypothetical protein
VFVRDGRVIREAHGQLNAAASNVAEMQAARRSLELAVDEGLVRKGGAVIVASDCTTVEGYVSGRYVSNRQFAELAFGIRRFAEKHGLDLSVVHVKGHARSKGGPHADHNHRADRLSKVATGIRLSDADVVAKQAENNERQRREAAEKRAARKAANLAREEARRGTSRRTVAAVNERFERTLATILRLEGGA